MEALPTKNPSPPFAGLSGAGFDLVALLLHSLPARGTLLAMLNEADVVNAPLRAIVAAIKQRPDAAPEGLMTDLDD